ncbi:C40 family peptidase [Actinomadura gamaensis]|uniref:C40 family peptidase n=1 Tax=Actinomadura gamaensis TaxID=1763541 RepID=A0ABV9U8C5_9ACTN
MSSPSWANRVRIDSRNSRSSPSASSNCEIRFALRRRKSAISASSRPRLRPVQSSCRCWPSCAAITGTATQQRLPLTQAAQTIQKSATPGAYAHQEARATQIVRALAGTADHPAALPTDTRDRITTGLVLTAARKLPRDQALTQVTDSLRRSPAPPGPDAVARQFHDDATQLCTELIKDTPGGPGNATGSGRGIVAVRAAMTQLGVPYSWGGGGTEGPSAGTAQGADTVGYDCSGLAQYAWAKAGTSITRTTDTQWHDGPHIPQDKLQPGDLIFFATNPSDPATIHHVALNIDGQRMIHAPQTGRTVEITRWTGNAYYESQYIGSIRPSPGHR